MNIEATTCDSYIGHRFLMQEGDSFMIVTLERCKVYKEYNDSCAILTEEYHNAFLNGLLTVPSYPECDNLFDIFEVDDEMKYDEQKMQQDIDEYGLYTYDEFKKYITKEQFDAFNMPYMKVSVGKGHVIYDTLIEFFVYIP